jgi:hypothetical protein
LIINILDTNNFLNEYLSLEDKKIYKKMFYFFKIMAKSLVISYYC